MGAQRRRVMNYDGILVLWGLWGLVGIWETSRTGYSQMLCKLTSSRRVLIPYGAHFSHIDPILAPELCPMDYTAAAPGGSCKHGQGPEDGLILGGRMCSLELEMLGLWDPAGAPSFPSRPTLAISSRHSLLSWQGRSHLRSGRKGRVLPLSQASLQYLPAYSHT